MAETGTGPLGYIMKRPPGRGESLGESPLRVGITSARVGTRAASRIPDDRLNVEAMRTGRTDRKEW